MSPSKGQFIYSSVLRMVFRGPADDYRRLNEETIPYRYSFRQIHYLIDILKCTTVFFGNQLG